MIAAAVGVKFDEAVSGEGLMPDAFGLTLTNKPYPKFNPLHFNFETTAEHNGHH